MELVAGRIVKVDEAHDFIAVPLAVEPANLDAALQHIHECLVLGNKRSALNLLELGNCSE